MKKFFSDNFFETVPEKTVTKTVPNVTVTPIFQKETQISLAIVGSRCLENVLDTIKEFFFSLETKDFFRKSVSKIVSGGAQGVDKCAETFALSANIPFTEYLPKKYVDYELLARNTLIAEDCTHVLAIVCPCSRGTWDTIKKAQKLNKHVTIKHLLCDNNIKGSRSKRKRVSSCRSSTTAETQTEKSPKM